MNVLELKVILEDLPGDMCVWVVTDESFCAVDTYEIGTIPNEVVSACCLFLHGEDV